MHYWSFGNWIHDMDYGSTDFFHRHLDIDPCVRGRGQLDRWNGLMRYE